ncbi:MAG TPA: hypothetical protein PKE69_20785 [Pyrinomonadaceae bacterium]|nr:hypothetical protein [Pyrinomonadaceae bacterium]
MISSIYHFFKDLCLKKDALKAIGKLDEFPFDENLFSCKRVGQFPDLAIKICKTDELFIGGELIELKDSKSYTVSSFNSTIPTGKKDIRKVFKSETSDVFKQMIKAGDDVFSLLERDVFYLIRGRKDENCKITLVHGSFFETVKVNELITKSFSQVLEERLEQSNLEIDDKTKSLLETIFSEQESFSKVRNVEKASVKLRFRIMTEVKTEGNILNEKKYPQIIDNTLNFVLPSHSADDDRLNFDKMELVFGGREFESFHIKHYFNGNFLVFQVKL